MIDRTNDLVIEKMRQLLVKHSEPERGQTTLETLRNDIASLADAVKALAQNTQK